jgi:hypothetical protein
MVFDCYSGSFYKYYPLDKNGKENLMKLVLIRLLGAQLLLSYDLFYPVERIYVLAFLLTRSGLVVICQVTTSSNE